MLFLCKYYSISQWEAPFCWDRIIARFCCLPKACASRSASSSISLLFFAFTSFLACSWFAFISLLYVGSFLIMCSIRGRVTSLLLLISSLSILGSVSPRLPSLAGKARRLLSLSVKAQRPDMAGMKTNLMVSSSGASWASVTGTVLKKNSHSLATLCMNAANAACGSLCAMEESCLISSTHSAIFCSMDLFTKTSSPIGVPRYFVPSVVIIILNSAKILAASSRCDGFVTTYYTLLCIGEGFFVSNLYCLLFH